MHVKNMKNMKTISLRGMIVMALKEITAKDRYGKPKVIETPAIKTITQEEVDNFVKSAKLRELANRIASKKNIPVADAIFAILEKLGETAIDKAEELKKKKKVA